MSSILVLAQTERSMFELESVSLTRWRLTHLTLRNTTEAEIKKALCLVKLNWSSWVQRKTIGGWILASSWKGDSCSPICGNISFLESGEAAQAMGNPQFQFCNIIDLIWFDYLPRPPEYLEKWGNLCIVCIYICIHIYIYIEIDRCIICMFIDIWKSFWDLSPFSWVLSCCIYWTMFPCQLFGPCASCTALTSKRKRFGV